MKNIAIIGSLLLSSFVLFGQNKQGKSDDAGRIALAAVVSDQIEGITPSTQSYLLSKLNRIVSKNGMGSSSYKSRFIITPNIVVLSKDVTTTAPPMQAYTLEVTLYIGDGIEGKLFSSTSSTLKGVGSSETKAYRAALKNIKTSDPSYQKFIDQAKEKIIEYYNTQCDFILKEADMLASKNEFDAAIAKLVGIPEVCKECYNKAMDAVAPMYKKKIDRDCKVKLSQAQGIWNARQDMDAAESAGAILASVEPEAACYGEVQALFNKIEKKVKQIDDREWKYTLKDQEQKSEMIEAYRAVGVAYGKGQPQNVTYNYSGWW